MWLPLNVADIVKFAEITIIVLFGSEILCNFVPAIDNKQYTINNIQ